MPTSELSGATYRGGTSPTLPETSSSRPDLDSNTRESATATVRIRRCDSSDATQLAHLHSDNISTRLSVRLLETYYRTSMNNRQNFCICAEADGEIVAYVGLVSNRFLLVEMLLRELTAVLGCILRRPALMLDILAHGWRWLKVPDLSSARIPMPRWEYRPVIVDKKYRGCGIARRLLAASDEVLGQTGVTNVYLLVDRENAKAVRLYQHSGFHVAVAGQSRIVAMLKTIQPCNLILY